MLADHLPLVGRFTSQSRRQAWIGLATPTLTSPIYESLRLHLVTTRTLESRIVLGCVAFAI